MFRLHRPRRLVPLAFAVGILFVGGLPVLAAGDSAPQLGIRAIDPAGAYINLTLKPGESRRIQVELGNFGASAATARTYAADVYSLINGGMGVRQDGEPTSGTTLWLDYPPKDLQLAASQLVTETITVRVPADVAPGDYITSLVIQAAAPIGTQGPVAFNQVVRQALAVSISVPGTRHPALALPSAALRTTPAGATFIDVAVVNGGNVLLKPAGSYVLADASGKTLAGSPVKMDSVYAGTSTTLAIPLAVALDPGHYTVDVTLADAATGIHVDSGPLPIDVAAPVAPLPSSGSATPAPTAPQAPSEPGTPTIVLVLVLGVVIGGGLAGGAFLIGKRSGRRPNP